MKPDYLYHYTSIESLAMILSTKKIRFNSLVHVDDLVEGKCKDFRYIGNYFFISSWTDMEKESLPFWNMYTPAMKGVRIRMPSDLFNHYLITTNGIPGLQNGFFNSIVPQEETFQSSYWVVPTQNEYLFKVDYTDESDKLYPQIETISGDTFTISLNKIGSYKSKHWAFQSEWRYIIKILPNISKEPAYINSPESNMLSDSLFSMRKGDRLPFTDYFVNINDAKFKEMEILMGPKHTEADRLIVDSLINNYNPGVSLQISDLYRKIK